MTEAPNALPEPTLLHALYETSRGPVPLFQRSDSWKELTPEQAREVQQLLQQIAHDPSVLTDPTVLAGLEAPQPEAVLQLLMRSLPYPPDDPSLYPPADLDPELFDPNVMAQIQQQFDHQFEQNPELAAGIMNPTGPTSLPPITPAGSVVPWIYWTPDGDPVWSGGAPVPPDAEIAEGEPPPGSSLPPDPDDLVPYRDYIPFIPMTQDPVTGEWRNAYESEGGYVPDPPPDVQTEPEGDASIPGVGVPYRDYIPFYPMIKDPVTGEWRNAEPDEIPGVEGGDAGQPPGETVPPLQFGNTGNLENAPTQESPAGEPPQDVLPAQFGEVDDDGDFTFEPDNATETSQTVQQTTEQSETVQQTTAQSETLDPIPSTGPSPFGDPVDPLVAETTIPPDLPEPNAFPSNPILVTVNPWPEAATPLELNPNLAAVDQLEAETSLELNPDLAETTIPPDVASVDPLLAETTIPPDLPYPNDANFIDVEVSNPGAAPVDPLLAETTIPPDVAPVDPLAAETSLELNPDVAVDPLAAETTILPDLSDPTLTDPALAEPVAPEGQELGDLSQ